MDKLELMETQILVLKKMYKTDLERKLDILIKSLQIELEQLRTNPYYRPNSCGIIQGSASDIDNIAIKLGVLDSVERG